MTDDADLLAALRRMWEDTDPVPPGLADEVLLRLAPELDDDAELLALLEPAALGDRLRGPAIADRIGFRLDDTQVLLQLGDAARGRRRVDGWVGPGQEGRAILLAGAIRLEAPVAATGRFAFAAVPSGSAVLELRLVTRRLRTPPFPIPPSS